MPYFFVDTTVSRALLFTHRSKTPAAPIFNKQSATKTPADHLLCVSQDLREAQLTMAKALTQISDYRLVISKWQPRATTEQREK